jgi:hypothetical protein
MLLILDCFLGEWTMKRVTLVLALVALLLGGTGRTAFADTIGTGSDFFQIMFDENGSSTVNVNQTGYVANAPAQILVDPNTGVSALTYLLPTIIGSGILDITYSDGSLANAISFYNNNAGTQGYMAYYSSGGGSLADTTNGGYVPAGPPISMDASGDHFEFYSGGAPLINNDYYGTSHPEPPLGIPTSVPEPASLTLICLGIAGMAGKSWRRRKRQVA